MYNLITIPHVLVNNNIFDSLVILTTFRYILEVLRTKQTDKHMDKTFLKIMIKKTFIV